MPHKIRVPFLRQDYRCDSLYTVLNGLNSAILAIDKKVKEIHWYDGLWAREEVEPVIGLAFVALQNYINKSIADYNKTFGLNIPKNAYYKHNEIFNTSDKTLIELIVALANYAKHDEDELPRKHTRETLDSFSLKYINFTIEESPIINGLAMICANWELTPLYEKAITWRESIWNDISKF